MLLLFLAGCSSSQDELDRAVSFRSKISNTPCSLTAKITADYGTTICTFVMDCVVSKSGDITFSVKEPETIQGITGVVSETGGDLRFDDKILGFPLMAEETISPVSGPWLMMQALRGGYIQSCGKDGDNLKIVIDDSYCNEALQAHIWIDQSDCVVFCEIIWQGSRVLSIEVENYKFL